MSEQVPDLDAFLAEPEPEHDWVVPGVLERAERWIQTGFEGAGKTTLKRQIGVQVASGVHPFTLEPIEPVTVLQVDLENPRRLARRELAKLRELAGDAYQGCYFPEVRPEGIDLRTRQGREWLEGRVDQVKPGLVLIGPLYKMASGDPSDERHAKAVSEALDHLRAGYGFALVMEAHCPHGVPGLARPTRPYGASLWLRWPEFGLHLSDDGALTHWRMPRDERAWPAKLDRGGDGRWPWSTTDSRWEAIVRECRAAGKRLTHDELAKRLEVNRSTISRTVNNYRAE